MPARAPGRGRVCRLGAGSAIGHGRFYAVPSGRHRGIAGQPAGVGALDPAAARGSGGRGSVGQAQRPRAAAAGQPRCAWWAMLLAGPPRRPLPWPGRAGMLGTHAGTAENSVSALDACIDCATKRTLQVTRTRLIVSKRGSPPGRRALYRASRAMPEFSAVPAWTPCYKSVDSATMTETRLRGCD